MAFIPAWRRLGLELKNAPAEEHVQTSGTIDENNLAVARSKKRKMDRTDKNVDEEDSQPVKKLKLETSPGLRSEAAQQQLSQESLPKREKSLQTSDIKDAGTKLQSREQTKSGKSKPQARKPRAQPTKINPETLDYLHQFYTSRSTWKFNKSKQIQLLRHIFDTTLIPPEHDDALLAYVGGLQGHAARERLQEQAKTILAEADEEPEMETPEAREQMKQEALKGERRKVKKYLYERLTHQERKKFEKTKLPQIIEKRKRADFLLQKLREYDDKYNLNHLRKVNEVNSEEKAENGGDGTKKKRGTRGRKLRTPALRTGVPDDDELSPSSISSSSFDEEDEEGSSEDEDDEDGTEDDSNEDNSEDNSRDGDADEDADEDEDEGEDEDNEE